MAGRRRFIQRRIQVHLCIFGALKDIKPEPFEGLRKVYSKLGKQ